ncbi:MAG: transcription termination/antitermination NusG family protein [Bryobacteraceae bacterium]
MLGDNTAALGDQTLSEQALRERALREQALREQALRERNVMTEEPRWYALMAKHQHERVLSNALAAKGFETLAPTYMARSFWSDRTKEVERALFPGYIFCKLGLSGRIPALDTPGISRIVGFGGRPTPIPDDEIEAIRAAVMSKLPIRQWPHLKPGDRVRIERGPLKGVSGTLIHDKDGYQFVVGVELLQRSIAVQLDADAVVPAPANPRVAYAGAGIAGSLRR